MDKAGRRVCVVLMELIAMIVGGGCCAGRG